VIERTAIVLATALPSRVTAGALVGVRVASITGDGSAFSAIVGSD
jgi:hypothetical protein